MLLSKIYQNSLKRSRAPFSFRIPSIMESSSPASFILKIKEFIKEISSSVELISFEFNFIYNESIKIDSNTGVWCASPLKSKCLLKIMKSELILFVLTENTHETVGPKTSAIVPRFKNIDSSFRWYAQVYGQGNLENHENFKKESKYLEKSAFAHLFAY